MNGKACMEVYPNSTLYTDEQVIEAMLRGDVQLAAPSLSLFESITKAYRLFDLPFMFKPHRGRGRLPGVGCRQGDDGRDAAPRPAGAGLLA